MCARAHSCLCAWGMRSEMRAFVYAPTHLATHVRSQMFSEAKLSFRRALNLRSKHQGSRSLGIAAALAGLARALHEVSGPESPEQHCRGTRAAECPLLAHQLESTHLHLLSCRRTGVHLSDVTAAAAAVG